MLEVKHNAREISDGKYVGHVWWEDESVPKGGQRVRPQVNGPGIQRPAMMRGVWLGTWG